MAFFAIVSGFAFGGLRMTSDTLLNFLRVQKFLMRNGIKKLALNSIDSNRIPKNLGVKMNAFTFWQVRTRRPEF